MRKGAGYELRSLILAGLIVALELVTVRILPLVWYIPPGTFIVRVSPQTVWYAMAGWILGPGWAMGAAMAGDVLGALLNPTGNGVFFPGYTITAALGGLCFGFILYGRGAALWRALLAAAVHSMLIVLPLTAYWGAVTGLYPGFWAPFWAALPWRAALVLPYTVAVFALQKALQRTVDRL